MKTKTLRQLLGLVAALAFASGAFGYSLITNDSGFPIKWVASPIVMQIKADNITHLSDGTTRATSIQAAMLDAQRGWNHNLGTVQFSTQIQSVNWGLDGDNENQIFFATTPYTYSWDSNTLAVTTDWYAGDQRRESDIIFNLLFTWDSYRGALKTGNVYDIQRVALHELGHVLGLDHPDAAGQSVSAIMNSVVSNTDSLQADDIAGAQALYGAPGVVPGNNNFASAATITLSNNAAQVTGTSVAATKETGEPNHGGDSGGHSVWWKWTAPSNGTLTVDTSGSKFDTTLGVYTGGSVSTLTTIASNDDVQDGVIRTSAVTFSATNGTTYYIAVDGWAGDSGSITLNASFVQPTPPTITGQPSDQTIVAGNTVYFSVSATGNPDPTYQWQRKAAGTGTWVNLSDDASYFGSAAPNLSVSNLTTAMNGDQFRGVASNAGGSTPSNAATLTVTPAIAPVISSLPSPVNLNYGDTLYLYPTVGGSAPMTFQWSKDGTPLPGSTSSQFYKSNITTADSGQYTLTATNVAGTTVSNTATVTVSPAVAPSISNLPATITTYFGDTLTMQPTVNGTSPMSFQWNKDGAPISGGNYINYTKFNIAAADSGNYTLTATNFVGSTTSAVVAVTVAPPAAPTITQQPVSVRVRPGTPVTFNVLAASPGYLSYQWVYDGQDIPGATSPSFHVYAAGVGNLGYYSVRVTNYLGSTTSNVVTLSLPYSGADFNGDGKDDLLWQNTITGQREVWAMNGTVLLGTGSLGGASLDWSIAAIADFNGDGQPDLLWQNTVTGERAIWLMNGTNFVSGVSLGIIPVEWSIAGAGDFNGDTQPDIVWQNTVTGERSVWIMNGTAFVSGVSLGVVPAEWSIAAIADFNADGWADVLYTNTRTGEITIWLMTGTSIGSGVSLGLVPPQLQVVGAGDYNGDGSPDILFSNTLTGERSVWLMNGTTHASTILLGTRSIDWELERPVSRHPHADFNDDGNSDLVWQNTSTGERAIWLMDGGAYMSGITIGVIPTDWTIAAYGDFNRDGKTDIIWQNTTTGERAIWMMDGGVFQSGVSLGVVPTDWSIAGTGDFNGDGKPDIFWQNTVTGERSVWVMDGAVFQVGASLGIIPADWSAAAIADFNGDGKPDILWQNKVTGERAIWLMSGTNFLSGLSLGIIPPEWSIAGTGDFNTDGKTDIIWQNTITGERAIWLMDGGTFLSGVTIGVIPVEWSIRD